MRPTIDPAIDSIVPAATVLAERSQVLRRGTQHAISRIS